MCYNSGMKTEQEVRQAYWDKGRTTALAAKELGISKTHVKRLMHRYGIPFRPLAEVKSHPLWIDLSDRESMAYIAGILLGDAWVARGKEVVHVSKDEAFTRSTAEAFRTVGLHPHVWMNPRGYWMMVVRSVAFARWWVLQGWNAQAQMAKAAPYAFVRGLYESEGCISLSHKERGVFPVLQWVTSHHPTADLFAELSPVLWFHRHPAVKEGRKTLCRLTVTRRALVDKFLATIQPCIKNSYANPVPSNSDNHRDGRA